MNLRAYPLIVLSSLLSLASCTSVSRQQCERADWRGRGEKDGAADHAREQSGWFTQWARSCASYPGAEERVALYDEGVRAGLARLCTPENARDLGRAGEAFPAACPEPERAKLRESYRQGFAHFDLVRREEDLRRREEELRLREEDFRRRELKFSHRSRP